MPTLTYEEEIDARAVKLGLWLTGGLDAVYADLISRSAETAASSGFDEQPRTRPCEHRHEWYRGKLCLACDNTGWRPCAPDEIGVDPYAADLRRDRVVVKSESSQRERDRRRIDSIIASLERDRLQREGIEAEEDPFLRALRVLDAAARRNRTARRIRKGLAVLRHRDHATYEALPSWRALRALAEVMYEVAPGRIEAPSW